eukprot:8579_1
MADRFLSKPSRIAKGILHDPKQFHLLIVAALYTAIKTNEQVALGSSSFAAMSRGIYSMKEIEAMELTILRGLSWCIYAPTSIQMAQCILSLVLPHVHLEDSIWSDILDKVKYQTERATRDYYFAAQRRST